MTAATAETQRPRRILVIDDSISIRTFLQISLSGNGYEVVEAENAALGLRKLETKPDAIVLDLGLPDKDGLDLLIDIRQQQPAVPVIILTVRNESLTRRLAKQRGANAYLTKPFQMEDLLEEIELLV